MRSKGLCGLLIVLLCAAPAQGTRVVVHPVPGGVGLNDGYRPFPIFCRGNSLLIHFQTRPKWKVTSGPSEGRLLAPTLSFNLALRRVQSKGKPSEAPLRPDEIEVFCQQGQAQVRAGAHIQLQQRP